MLLYTAWSCQRHTALLLASTFRLRVPGAAGAHVGRTVRFRTVGSRRLFTALQSRRVHRRCASLGHDTLSGAGWSATVGFLVASLLRGWNVSVIVRGTPVSSGASFGSGYRAQFLGAKAYHGASSLPCVVCLRPALITDGSAHRKHRPGYAEFGRAVLVVRSGRRPSAGFSPGPGHGARTRANNP